MRFLFSLVLLYYIFNVDDDENELRVGWVFKLMHLNQRVRDFFSHFIFEPQEDSPIKIKRILNDITKLWSFIIGWLGTVYTSEMITSSNNGERNIIMSHPHVTMATPTHWNKISKMIKREIQTLYNIQEIGDWGIT